MVSKLGWSTGEKGLGKDWDLGALLVPPALSLYLGRPRVIAALQSFIPIPSLPSWLFVLLLQLLRQFVTEQLAIRKKSELIKLTHYRFNLEINKMQASEKNRMSCFQFSIWNTFFFFFSQMFCILGQKNNIFCKSELIQKHMRLINKIEMFPGRLCFLGDSERQHQFASDAEWNHIADSTGT